MAAGTNYGVDGNDDTGGRGTTDATGATALGGAVSVEELFPAGWVRTHTEWRDIESMLSAGEFGRAIGPGADRQARRRLDRHVAETTEFDSWAAMLERAVTELADERGLMDQ